ncbi:MAG: hypothetical protein ACTSUE_13655 [Promethearchaeota archaeon]
MKGKIHFYKTYGITMLVASMSFAGIFGYLFVSNLARPMISTSSYHFNVQYRAGNETAMTEVINNSLVPLLEMYDRHPRWKANIEFQSLLVEWMEAVNPDGLALLRKLTGRGQIQLICVQYSSALALAYPYVDFYKSVNYTRTLLTRLGFINESAGNTSAVSRAVLLQEGQFMLGAAKIARDFKHENGTPVFDTFLTTTESLSYFGISDKGPLYTWDMFGQQNYVLPYYITGVEAGALHHILWFQDGENVNTGSGETWGDDGYTQHNGTFFEENPERTLNHERRLMDLEKQGNIFMTIDEWMDYLLARNAHKPLTHFVPETHWAAFRYRGSFIWMSEFAGGTAYDDGEINSKNYRTHQYLLGTEILFNYTMSLPGSNITGTLRSNLTDKMTKAWLDLNEAQVTDSTGLSPRDFEGETAIIKTNYALANASEILNTIINLTTVLNLSVNGSGEGIQVNPYNYEPFLNWSSQDWANIIIFDNSSFVHHEDLGAAVPSSIPYSPSAFNNYSSSFRNMTLNASGVPLIDGLNYTLLEYKFNPLLPSSAVAGGRYWAVSTGTGTSFNVLNHSGSQQGYFNDASASSGINAKFSFTYNTSTIPGNIDVSWKMNATNYEEFTAGIVNVNQSSPAKPEYYIVQLKFGAAGSIQILEDGSWTNLGPALWVANNSFKVTIHCINQTHSWFQVGSLTLNNGGNNYRNNKPFMDYTHGLRFTSNAAAMPKVYIDNINASWRWDATHNFEEDFEYLVNPGVDPWAYVTFTGDFDTIQYSPSMWENETITLDRDDYYPDTVSYYGDWDERSTIDNFDLYLPLSNGMVYIAATQTAIVKNCSGSHVCMKWTDNQLMFMQTKTYNRLNTTWQFFLLEGVTVEEAVAFSNLVNAKAPLTIEGGL